jgi:malonyl-CoA/methylmalonyl-CoA synthetase
VVLTRAWAQRWAADPDRTVLLGPGGPVADARELDRCTRDGASRLAAAGVGRGDRVLLSCAPSPATVVAYVAALRLGAVVVPANTAYTRPELEHLVADAAPALAVIDDPARVEGLGVPGASSLASLPEGRAIEVDASEPGDPAMIAYTSGTTGRPKGAVLSHANLLAGARAVVEAWEWTSADRLVLALPLFHMHGLGVGVNGTLLAGASAVVLPAFSPDAVADAVRDHDATMFFGVPTMWARFAASPRLTELASLRLLVSGSAPLPEDLFEAVRIATGQAPLERYGMSETVMLAANPLRGDRRAGTVGRPLPGVEIRLAEGGGVEVRGPNVSAGYWRRPDATSEAFTADGWFRTGDLGEWDEAGYLRLVGRASELIITGGYNVYPREVEDALRAHPAVAEAAVVGMPDPEWGEVVAAYVVERAPVTDEALAAHLADRLAPYKRPRRWVRLDALPRNAMGKVVRADLPPHGA